MLITSTGSGQQGADERATPPPTSATVPEGSTPSRPLSASESAGLQVFLGGDVVARA